MQEPYAHTMMPQASHDEVAREQFVATFKMHMEDNVYPADETVYRQRAEPEFARTNNRSPETRQEVRRLMEADPFFQMWSSVARNLQEMLWYNVGECVERQLPELIEKARTQTKNGRGSLTLDPGLEIPRYNASIDIHCMPGGYHSEITDKDDVFAGALYDRGAYYYVMGLLGGRGNEMTDAPESFLMERAGHNIVDYLRAEFPDLKVRPGPRYGLHNRQQHAAIRGGLPRRRNPRHRHRPRRSCATVTRGPRRWGTRSISRSRTRRAPTFRTGTSTSLSLAAWRTRLRPKRFATFWRNATACCGQAG